MTTTPKILILAGSLRRDSLNKKLARAAATMVRDAGGDPTLIDLADYPLPLYNGDIEASEGLPANARALKEHFNAADGLLIASPEYNSSISGALKNMIDWVSRRASSDEPHLHSLAGKTAGLVSASIGALGGLRGLYHLREILLNINVIVLPEMQAIVKAEDVLGEESINDERQRAGVERVAKRLVQVAGALAKR